MNNLNYIRWKNWSEGGFAEVNAGSKYYFDQVLIKCYCPEKCSVLEIGFGNGQLLGYLRAKGCNVVGVEINEELVIRATQAGFQAYKGQVWSALALKGEIFDLVIGFDVAEHMCPDDLYLLFRWAKKHISDDGKLILRFPEGTSPFGLSAQNGDFTHQTNLTRTKIEALCDATGLELISYKDNPLSSNTLCAWGWAGRFILKSLQAYSTLLKAILKLLLYPLCRNTNFSVNSLAVISHKERN